MTLVHVHGLAEVAVGSQTIALYEVLVLPAPKAGARRWLDHALLQPKYANVDQRREEASNKPDRGGAQRPTHFSRSALLIIAPSGRSFFVL